MQGSRLWEAGVNLGGALAQGPVGGKPNLMDRAVRREFGGVAGAKPKARGVRYVCNKKKGLRQRTSTLLASLCCRVESLSKRV